MDQQTKFSPMISQSAIRIDDFLARLVCHATKAGQDFNISSFLTLTAFASLMVHGGDEKAAVQMTKTPIFSWGEIYSIAKNKC